VRADPQRLAVGREPDRRGLVGKMDRADLAIASNSRTAAVVASAQCLPSGATATTPPSASATDPAAVKLTALTAAF
jgi:hypothetical protein